MIPFVDLTRQHSSLEKELSKTFSDFLNNGIYILGSSVAEFEGAIARYIGIKHTIGVASGTDAIELALRSLELPPNSEVLIPANAYPSVWGIIASGLRPVPVDVKPDYSIDLVDLERKFSSKTKAILVVHLYGFPMLTNDIAAFAKRHSLLIVEDCAQALGATQKGVHVGTQSTLAIHSFYPTKPLGAYGDAGLVMTNSSKLAKKIQLLRMYGEKNRYKSVLIGKNSRLDELQAALMLKKLKYIERWRKDRLKIATIYKRELHGVGDLEFVDNPYWDTASHHLCVVRTSNRTNLKIYLQKNKIQTAIHYPVDISNIPSLKSILPSFRTPNAAQHSKQILSLPIYSGLTSDEQTQIILTIKNFFSKKN